MRHFSDRCSAALCARLPALVGTIFFASTARAVDRTYVGPASGLWQTGTNWSPAGAPVANDNAILPQTYVGSYTVSFGVVSYSILSPLNSVRISSQGGVATATLVQDQAASSMAALEMHVGLVGTGVYSQSAGVNTITSNFGQPGLQVGEGFSGIYNLSGGTLAVAAGREFIGNVGNGTFNQTGSTSFNTANQLFVGANTPASGTVAFQQGEGTYNLSAGTLNVGDFMAVGDENGRGHFTQTGGSVVGPSLFWAVGNGSNSIGTYTLSAGTVSAAQAGVGQEAGGVGVMNQSGGVNTSSQVYVTGSFGTGTYNLSGGTLATDFLVTGNVGTAEFVQTGGTVTCNDLSIALEPGGHGRQRVAGGTLTAANVIIGGGSSSQIGQSFEGGSGTLVVSAGGLVTVSNTIKVWDDDDTLIINGGTITCGSIDTSGGGHLQFTGGAINFTNPVTLGGALSTLDLGSGQQVSVLGAVTLSGGSSIRLHGGTFAPSSINVAGGTIDFTGGTLRLSGSNLTIGASGLFGNALQLDSGEHLDVAGSTTINPGAQLQMNGGSLSSTTGSGTLSNAGLIAGTGTLAMRLNQTSTGEVRALASNVLRFTGTSNSSAGLVTIGGDGVVEFTAGLTNTGTIAGRGSVFAGAGGIANNGTVALSGGFADVHGTLTNGATAKAIVTGGSTSTFYNVVTNAAGSEFRVSTNSTAVFLGPVIGLAAFTGSGTTVFEGSASGGPLAKSAGATVVESGGSLSAQSIRERALTVNGVARIVPDGTAAATSHVASLTIDGGPGAWTGVLDLSDNALVIDYTGSSPLTTVASQIKQGYNGGAWTGSGLTSSAAAATSTSAHHTALGFAEASALGLTTTFRGQPTDASSVLIRHTFAGDSSLDGTVDLTDFTFLAANFNGTNKTWLQGDYNYDGTVDLTDFTFLASNFNQSMPADGDSLGSAVPEPHLIFAALSLSLLGMRRRRC